MFTNASSIIKQWDAFECRIMNEKPDIIGIVETWLDEDIKDAEIQLPGYKIFRADRERKTVRCGGAALYIKETLDTIQREDFEFRESVWCELCNIETEKTRSLINNANYDQKQHETNNSKRDNNQHVTSKPDSDKILLGVVCKTQLQKSF